MDSLSRQIAAAIVPDTLQYDGAASGTDDHRLEFPRTIRFTRLGAVLVSDAQRNSIFQFDAAGTLQWEAAWPGASVPYLAGMRGDTAIVFSPGSRRIDYLVRGAPVHTIHTPDSLPETALQYVVFAGTALYIKVAGKRVAPWLARMDEDGRIQAQRRLGGSTWRNAGPLRARGDSLMSFNGFFPMVDILPLSLAGPADSLALLGFDSPMLARTYSFAQGKGRGAPLLASSAALSAQWLFVLNLRPGWLRIDVYDRAGRLHHVLLQPDPGYNREYYPIDIAVRRDGDTRFRIAVAVVEPEPAVHLYTWHTGSASSQTTYRTRDS